MCWLYFSYFVQREIDMKTKPFIVVVCVLFALSMVKAYGQVHKLIDFITRKMQSFRNLFQDSCRKVKVRFHTMAHH